MPTKIRLQRKGKKGQPFYHVVIADGRAPRDGKFIEKIGTYNPLLKPAGIDLDFDRALYWLQTGAQPTDTVRSILSYKGILFKNHLQKGVTKGALTQEQADAKFDAWLREKEEKIAGKVNEVENESRDDKKKRLDAEKKVNADREKMLAERRLAELKMNEPEAVAEEAVAEVEEVVAEAAAEVVAEEVKEEVVAEVVAEEVATEVVKDEVVAETEKKVEEKAEEVAEVVEDAKEEVVPEVKAETKEEKAEEPAKEEEKKDKKAE